jgi:nucleotide-binding universal stress UspA family protein
VVDVTSAADDLADQHSQRADRIIARIGSNVIKTIVPDVFESGPETGEWRNSILSGRRDDRLFCEILVPINGNEDGWYALEQSIVIARREEARIHGLFVLSTEADIDSPSTLTIQDEFARRCEAVSSQCELQFKIGDITHTICERARWNDLVVMNLAYPPEATPLARLSSGIRNLIQRCPRPLLFVPQITNSLNNALLAYDGSPKAQEALFIAAYMAGQWKIPLSVITIGEAAAEKQDQARVYLNNLGVQANYVIEDNNVVELILHYSKQLNIDLLLMGGYSRNPVMEVALGGVVDKVLRESHKPMLICR